MSHFTKFIALLAEADIGHSVHDRLSTTEVFLETGMARVEGYSGFGTSWIFENPSGRLLRVSLGEG